MQAQEIEILKKQINKLDSTDFDLEAWKTGAIILLERLFGQRNQKITQMEKIKYDQSSWALREAKGSKNMMETCKKQGKEILEIAIEELEQTVARAPRVDDRLESGDRVGAAAVGRGDVAGEPRVEHRRLAILDHPDAPLLALHLDPESGAIALDRQASEPQHRRLGTILAEMGLISEEQVSEVLRERLQSITEDFLLLDRGFFSFKPDEEDKELFYNCYKQHKL